MADLVIPDPEFHQLEITDKDEFLILASDGLWDVVSTDLAVQRAKEAFVMHKTPDEAAEELCELALKLGSSDNVTIVVVQFTHSK